MKKSLLLVLGFVSILNLVNAQNTGFYGKRFILQVGLTGHHNTIRNLAFKEENDLKNSTDQYKTKEYTLPYQFSGGFYGSFGYQIKKRFALGLDFQYYLSNKYISYISVPIDDWNSYNYEGQVKYSAIRIMPRIEVSSAGALAPIGLVHIFAIGAEITKANTRNLSLYEANTSNNPPVRVELGDIKSRVSLVLLYGLEYRHPFTKNISLNLGAYVHLNGALMGVGDVIGNNYYNYETYQYRIGSRIQESRLANVFSMRAGVLFSL